MKKQVESWIGFAEKDMLTISEIIENHNLTNKEIETKIKNELDKNNNDIKL